MADGEAILVFVLDPFFFEPERARTIPHRMQFLLESLRELEERIAQKGGRLFVVRGRSVEIIPQLARKWRVDRVAAYRWVEPFARMRDRKVAARLDVPFELYEGETLLPPGTLRSGSGRPYAAFSPYARAFRKTASIDPPLPEPRRLPSPPEGVTARTVKVPTCRELGITENERLVPGGERAAKRRLREFLHGPAKAYDTLRDRMDLPGTSRLSQDLKFGTLSARTVWSEVADAFGRTQAGRAFLNELVWREFTHSTLWDRPSLLHAPFRPEFRGFPWGYDEELWSAWTEGKTGYPIVDASARQLLGEGFVHNRARMISASFLTKHCLIHYKHGEAHYLAYLTDGDWAQNNAGWQWSAGSGCDAQPYFRVFNPVTQGERFDPQGEYVRRWVPELRRVPTKFIHAPWKAAPEVLEEAGVRLGDTYPHPVVEHKEARARFLELAKQHLK